MSGVELGDPHRAPEELVRLYTEQLFGHCRQKVARFLEISKPYSFAAATRQSYELWLSYAMVETAFSDVRGLRLTGGSPTKSTVVHEEFLKRASKDELAAYYNWAFPPRPDGRLRGNLDFAFLVCPVHFWYFNSCQRQNRPYRPISPTSTNDLFFHPLFLTSKHKGPLLWVVPEYFLGDCATFDGLTNPGSTPYYVFPYFSQRLFEYVTESAAGSFTGSFLTYYSTREAAWFIPAGIDASGLIDPPHPLLKRHWRWEEVLTMLHKSKHPGKGPRPRVCRNPPHDYHRNPQIVAYFESFARMATAWVREHAE